MTRPIRFIIEGLFGTKDVDIPVRDNALIIVGPNGVGKSSVTNIFYYFISRQWSRLLEYQFEKISIHFEDIGDISATRDELSGLVNLDTALSRIPPSSRMRSHIEILREQGLLESFLAKKAPPSVRSEAAQVLGISTRDVQLLSSTLQRRLFAEEDAGLFDAPRQDIEKRLSRAIPGRTLYLPTYRRIERDLEEIFPELEDRMRGPGYRAPSFEGRSGQNYIDLVSFGMEDVKKTIKTKLNYLRDYSLGQFNELSGLYLRDVIRGTAQEFSENEISSLSEGALARILSRVSEQVLSDEEKGLLRDKIVSISAATGPYQTSDTYLAHYFMLLMKVSDEIAAQESDIIEFQTVCNSYLEPEKEMHYDDVKFTLEIHDETGRPIDLSVLSSGEKQVISLFSHLYLDPVGTQFVIIDEPELSLSVPWQKKFLPDIVNSGRCNFLLAVTHSPFVYQNSLGSCSVDLRKYTELNFD